MSGSLIQTRESWQRLWLGFDECRAGYANMFSYIAQFPCFSGCRSPMTYMGVNCNECGVTGIDFSTLA